MLLYVDLNNQVITDQPFTSSPIDRISVPRASSIPIEVRFVRDGVIVDPEATIATIRTSSVAAATVITTVGPHGFVSGETVTIADHIGAEKTISSSSVAAATVITTAAAHGLTTADTIEISGHNGSVPAIDGTYAVASTPSSTTFTIALTTTVAGSGGTVARATSTPTINGDHVITRLTDYTFTVPVNVTVAGQDGTATRITAMDLRWTVKETDSFDGSTVAGIAAGDFTKFGLGEDTIFKGACNYITTDLNTLLGVDPPTTANDEEEVTLMAELSWGGDFPSKTNWITHVLRNDLYKTGEASPVSAAGSDVKTALASGISTKSVTFAVALSSANWHFLGTPFITNTTDATPLGLSVVALTARSASGFTVAFSGATDSANYVLEWSARVDV